MKLLCVFLAALFSGCATHIVADKVTIRIAADTRINLKATPLP